MRFYLDLPLVVGYVLMAITACLGMLQLAAARGGYAGLSLFTTQRGLGVRLGAGLTVGALLAYVLFAPEILTPGPAGTEVAETFALCALIALVITLTGAGHRIQRERRAIWPVHGGEPMLLGDVPATLYRPANASSTPLPAVVLLPDPTGFVIPSTEAVEALCRAGFAVLALDAQGMLKDDVPRLRQTLLGNLSIALVQLASRAEIDQARTGLLGLGLGGDAVLGATAADPQVKAAMAVSPVWSAAPGLGTADSGLHWLHELNYWQAWRWQRDRSTFRRAAADLHARTPWALGSTSAESDIKSALPVAAAALQGGDGEMAIRKEWRGIELLTVPCQRYFTLLTDEQAIKLTVAWFQEKFGINHPGGSRITSHKHVT